MRRPFKGPHPPDKHPALMGGRCGVFHARKRVNNGGCLRRKTFRVFHYENATSRWHLETGRQQEVAPKLSQLSTH